jgi:hypothetical protein
MHLDNRLACPGKRSRSISCNEVYMDNFDKSAIRNTIQDFLLIEKRVPMILKLLPIIKEKIHVP